MKPVLKVHVQFVLIMCMITLEKVVRPWSLLVDSGNAAEWSD